MNNVIDSRDRSPWEHPYLTSQNISRFRSYSEEVWDFALNYYKNHPEPLDCAFTFNMAQNMYKWARLAQSYGTKSTLYLHEMDKFPFSQPEWEDYDGELSDLSDCQKFQELTGHLQPEVRTVTIPIDSEEFRMASSAFVGRNQNGGDARRLLMCLRRNPTIRYEVFDMYPALMAYFDWANALSAHQVIYAAGAPFCAYASGIPYCVVTVGGDVERDCGRGDWFGRSTTLAYNSGRFMMISNPHTLGHSRRLGFTNGVYLPYPMDVHRYSPGEGQSRREWNEKYGPGIYVLTTARIDSEVKGQSDSYFKMLVDLTKEIPALKFIFLAWGNNLNLLQNQIRNAGLDSNLILLPPVGKKRLIDYYRSSDIVLDQFVYGYYGATALEAFSVGKPVIMMIRESQYDALYRGDVAPVRNVATLDGIRETIAHLSTNIEERHECGNSLRKWLVRNHGEDRTMPILLSLLRVTADRVALPGFLNNPLCDDLTCYEIEYHNNCLGESVD